VRESVRVELHLEAGPASSDESDERPWPLKMSRHPVQTSDLPFAG
jgi:hypothetical protein